MKKICVLFVLMLPLLIQAQSNNNYPPKNKYKEGTITFTDYSSVDCKDININKDSLMYVDKNTGISKTVAMSGISKMKVVAGNYCFPFMAFGAIIILPATIAAGLSGGGIVFCVAIGAVTGGVCGLFMPSTKTYRINY